MRASPSSASASPADDRPNPGLVDPIDPGCRFVGRRAVPAHIRYALSNSFGFGGFNSSILLANPVS